MENHQTFQPNYEKFYIWEAYHKDLPMEYRQCFDEGKDIAPYEELIRQIGKLADGKDKANLADALFSMISELPLRSDYAYEEPSDYPAIAAAAKPLPADLKMPKEEDYYDKLKGAWYGRLCGCLLGKPVECILRKELTPFLKATGNFPLHRYITRSDIDLMGDLHISFPIRETVYPDGILDAMPVDDDANYNVLSLLLLQRYGRDFTPEDVAELWMDVQPKTAYCTAERVAYRNFVNGYYPPQSAQYKNPYRELIGAQIRGDLFGWINPGDPKTAAEFAWRDASISHIKNGIYGEMWVSAMLAGVGGGASISDAIRIGLSYIPQKSRLQEAVQNVLTAFESGVSAEAFFADLAKRWDDTVKYDSIHTISNAEIVAAALLWGNGDYEKSICLAVQEGFDTDCNGATVGSVVGLYNGFSALPTKWISKINGTLLTDIRGHGRCDIEGLVKETMAFLNCGTSC